MIIFVLLFAALAWSSPSTDRQLKEQREALKRIERELASQRQALKQMETEESGVLNTLSLLDQNLGHTREYLDQLQQTESSLAKSIQRVAYEIDSLDSEAATRRLVMSKRISALYRGAQSEKWKQFWRLVRLKEQPGRQILRVRRLLSHDEELVQSMRQILTAKQERQEKLSRNLAEMKRVRQRKAVEEEGLVSQIHNQETALEALKRDKNLQKKALAEFERNQRALATIIKALEKKRLKEEAESRKKAKQKKNVVVKSIPLAAKEKCLPLKGDLLSSFGNHEHRQLRTVTRNLGVEIRGARGSSIRSAAKGTVVMVTRIEGRGPSIIVDHGQSYYSVYGHLADIHVKEGQTVEKCQEIAEAGDAESLDGIKLYFQVNQGTKTLDPLQWIRSDK